MTYISIFYRIVTWEKFLLIKKQRQFATCEREIFIWRSKSTFWRCKLDTNDNLYYACNVNWHLLSPSHGSMTIVNGKKTVLFFSVFCCFFCYYCTVTPLLCNLACNLHFLRFLGGSQNQWSIYISIIARNSIIFIFGLEKPN